MIKKISIIFIILFFLGVIFEHYKLYPRNEIVFIIKKILFNELKISKSTEKCFANLKNINNDDNPYIYFHRESNINYLSGARDI